jgi:hypothetical protein
VSVGRPPLREREIPYVHSHTVYEAIHYLFPGDEELEKKALEQLKKIHLRDYIVHLKMEPHLLETLELLKKKGIHDHQHQPNDIDALHHGEIQSWAVF